jgi:hypothetical protein
VYLINYRIRYDVYFLRKCDYLDCFEVKKCNVFWENCCNGKMIGCGDVCKIAAEPTSRPFQWSFYFAYSWNRESYYRMIEIHLLRLPIPSYWFIRWSHLPIFLVSNTLSGICCECCYCGIILFLRIFLLLIYQDNAPGYLLWYIIWTMSISCVLNLKIRMHTMDKFRNIF